MIGGRRTRGNLDVVAEPRQVVPAFNAQAAAGFGEGATHRLDIDVLVHPRGPDPEHHDDHGEADEVGHVPPGHAEPVKHQRKRKLENKQHRHEQGEDRSQQVRPTRQVLFVRSS